MNRLAIALLSTLLSLTGCLDDDDKEPGELPGKPVEPDVGRPDIDESRDPGSSTVNPETQPLANRDQPLVIAETIGDQTFIHHIDGKTGLDEITVLDDGGTEVDRFFILKGAMFDRFFGSE